MDQQVMTASIDALIKKSVGPTSLLDLGYSHAGIDGGSSLCAAGGHSHHDAAGNPTTDTGKFPDMAGSVLPKSVFSQFALFYT
jgi:hypothetical protein